MGIALIVLGVLVVLVLIGALVGGTESGVGETESGRCYVVDADDIRVNNKRIRLAGIDAPEYRQLGCREGRWYDQGSWVKSVLINVIGGKWVRVKIVDTDHYGRLIGKVECPEAGIDDVSEWMVRNGLAIAAYSNEYEQDEYYAKHAATGIWGDEISYDPRYYKHGKRVHLS